MAFDDGPFIQASCFCELAIRDDSGVLSLIRIVDTITHTESGSPPDEMPPVSYPLKLVLMLKSGMARGRSNLRVVPEQPDGSTDNPLNLSVHFEGEERGANVVADFRYTYKHEGLYWFHVYIEEHKLTSMPLRVKYNRVQVG